MFWPIGCCFEYTSDFVLVLIHSGFCHCLVPRITGKCCFTDKIVFSLAWSFWYVFKLVLSGWFFFLVSFNDECVLCLWSALLIVSMVQVRTHCRLCMCITTNCVYVFNVIFCCIKKHLCIKNLFKCMHHVLISWWWRCICWFFKYVC